MLWGGRFEHELDDVMWAFNASLPFDRRLWQEDIHGSIAWAQTLAAAGILTADEVDQLVNGLQQVEAEMAAGTFSFQPQDEDIHTAVERRLTELVGPLGGKLHTGRSRNDQIATDMRLYVLGQCGRFHKLLQDLQQAIVEQAGRHTDTLMPGYTHLQQAQPVLFGHWLMSFFWKFQRDQTRLRDLAERTAVLPLGSGALAGNPFGIDREALAETLNFAEVSDNSIDAVADRDFVVEFLSWAALVQVHLSGLAEDLVLWSSREFGYVLLDDRYTTGSSLMPQKKNPDSMELIRGKSGRVVGNLCGLLTTLKGLPSTYNKDLQEDKEPLFDTIDTLSMELPIAAGVLRTLQVNRERMAAALDSAMLATDMADYLVKKGVPFRQSHEFVGRAVRRAEELQVGLDELPLKDLKAIHPAFGPDIEAAMSFNHSVAARNAAGGTSPATLQAQLDKARKLLAA